MLDGSVQTFSKSKVKSVDFSILSEPFNNNQNAVVNLAKMDSYFPPELIPFDDPYFDFQVATLYQRAGDTLSYTKRLNLLVNRDD